MFQRYQSLDTCSCRHDPVKYTAVHVAGELNTKLKRVKYENKLLLYFSQLK